MVYKELGREGGREGELTLMSERWPDLARWRALGILLKGRKEGGREGGAVRER
jgi:hypothetical protein